MSRGLCTLASTDDKGVDALGSSTSSKLRNRTCLFPCTGVVDLCFELLPCSMLAYGGVLHLCCKWLLWCMFPSVQLMALCVAHVLLLLLALLSFSEAEALWLCLMLLLACLNNDDDAGRLLLKLLPRRLFICPGAKDPRLLLLGSWCWGI